MEGRDRSVFLRVVHIQDHHPSELRADVHRHRYSRNPHVSDCHKKEVDI